MESDARYAWLADLDEAELKRFRFIVIELILATDMKRHFEILAEFNANVNEPKSLGMDWSSEPDRLLFMQMLMKLADLNSPTKNTSIYLVWTEKVVEEFFRQGEEEAKMGKQISPCMDRNRPQTAKLQESFINHLVKPLVHSIAAAGLLPGTWISDRPSGACTSTCTICTL